MDGNNIQKSGYSRGFFIFGLWIICGILLCVWWLYFSGEKWLARLCGSIFFDDENIRVNITTNPLIDLETRSVFFKKLQALTFFLPFMLFALIIDFFEWLRTKITNEKLPCVNEFDEPPSYFYNPFNAQYYVARPLPVSNFIILIVATFSLLLLPWVIATPNPDFHAGGIETVAVFTLAATGALSAVTAVWLRFANNIIEKKIKPIDIHQLTIYSSLNMYIVWHLCVAYAIILAKSIWMLLPVLTFLVFGINWPARFKKFKGAN